MATQFGDYRLDLDSVGGVASVEDSVYSQRLDDNVGGQQLPSSALSSALATRLKTVPKQTVVVVILVILLWRILYGRKKAQDLPQLKNVESADRHSEELQSAVEKEYHTHPGTGYFVTNRGGGDALVEGTDDDDDDDDEEYFTADESGDSDADGRKEDNLDFSDIRARAALEAYRPSWQDPPCIMTIPLTGRALEAENMYPSYSRVWRMLSHGDRNGDDLMWRLEAARKAKAKPDSALSVEDRVHLMNQEVATHYETILKWAEVATQNSWLVDVPSMKDRLNEEQSALLSPVLDSVEVLSKVNDLKTVTGIVGNFDVDTVKLYKSIEPVIQDAREAGKNALELLDRASDVRKEAIDAFQRIIKDLESIDKHQTLPEAKELVEGLRYAIWREANGIKWLKMQKEVIMRVENTFLAYDRRYTWMNAWGKLMWATQLGTRLMDIKSCEKYVDPDVMKLGEGDEPVVTKSSHWLYGIDSLLYPVPREGKMRVKSLTYGN